MKHKKKDKTGRSTQANASPEEVVSKSSANPAPSASSKACLSAATQSSDLTELLQDLLKFLSSKLPQSFTSSKGTLKYRRTSWKDGKLIETCIKEFIDSKQTDDRLQSILAVQKDDEQLAIQQLRDQLKPADMTLDELATFLTNLADLVIIDNEQTIQVFLKKYGIPTTSYMLEQLQNELTRTTEVCEKKCLDSVAITPIYFKEMIVKYQTEAQIQELFLRMQTDNVQLFEKYDIPLEDPSSSPRQKITGQKHRSSTTSSSTSAAGAVDVSRTLLLTVNALLEDDNLEAAVEQLSQAITLIVDLSGDSFPEEDLLSIYNSRSAANEKLQRYDAALEDIALIVTKNPNHMKARQRRARIYELQDRGSDAFEDYVYIDLIERLKSPQKSFANNHQMSLKINEMCKVFAGKRTTEFMTTLLHAHPQQPDSRLISRHVLHCPLPSNRYIRSYLQGFPSYYTWKAQYPLEGREDLQAAALEYKAMIGLDQHEANNMYLEFALYVICHDLVNGQYRNAFDQLHNLQEDLQNSGMLSEDIEVINVASKPLLSSFYELCGIEVQLRASIAGHEECLRFYRLSHSLNTGNLSVSLRIVSSLLEVGKVLEAKQEIAILLQHWSSSSTASHFDAATIRAYRAWILIFRSKCWIARDIFGNYELNAQVNAMNDLNEVLKLTKNPMSMEAKSARFHALLQCVHVRNQWKSLDKSSGSECVEWIEQAKKIFPDHELVKLVTLQQLFCDCQFDEVLTLLDSAEISKCLDEVSVLLFRTQALVGRVAAACTESNECYAWEEIMQLYTKAIELEPNSFAVIMNTSNFQSAFMFNFSEALKLAKSALSFVRTRDEVLDVFQAIVLNEALLHASKNNSM